MPKQPRIPRTLFEKIEALDDQLFLLREAWHNLAKDNARLKSLAATLRVLICESSNTEGLLWRLARELSVDDTICAHIPGRVDVDHPLSKGLQLMHVPLFRSGKGDARLPAIEASFRWLIKEHWAVYANGEHITHERLIGLVANQIGSSHEDDGVSPSLQFLRSIFVNNRPTFFDILIVDADFTVEIGERILLAANEKLGYGRKPRSGYGDFSITICLGAGGDLVGETRVAIFDSPIFNTSIEIVALRAEIQYRFHRSGRSVAMMSTPFPPEWNPGETAAFSLSYSSRFKKCRTIVNGVAMPEVDALLGFLDIREFEIVPQNELGPLKLQLLLTNEKLVRPVDIRNLVVAGPPYFGLLRAADSTPPIFP